MEYRDNSALGVRTSLLGFGAMRLPTDGEGKIREAESTALLHRALEGGINYIDTAHNYLNSQSEAFLGRALADVPRESYYLATKLPVWMVESAADADSISLTSSIALLARSRTVSGRHLSPSDTHHPLKSTVHTSLGPSAGIRRPMEPADPAGAAPPRPTARSSPGTTGGSKASWTSLPGARSSPTR